MASFDTSHLRNIGLVSHSGTGKTTTVEALLYATKGISRMGKVEDGNTVSDHEPEEVRRGASIQLSVVPCIWNQHKVNVLDTPGYSDFSGEVVSALHAVDTVVLVVAAQAGLEVGTQNAWDLCQERHLPTMVFINKMDRENADFERALASIQDSFGSKCVAIQMAIGKEQDFSRVVSLLNPTEDIPDSLMADFERLRERLIEAIAETDDDLTTKFLEGEELSLSEVTEGLKKGITAGTIVPVMVGSAHLDIGIRELLDATIELLPSPADSSGVAAIKPGQDEPFNLPVDSDGPLAAVVFKTTADPFVGKLSYFRVVSGTFSADSQVWNANKAQSERIAQVFVPTGKSQEALPSLAAGDIGAVSKLSVTVTSDTLGLRESPVMIPPIEFPSSMFTSAIYPKSKADVDKMASSINRLTEEDPTLTLWREPLTGETLLSGLGETHIDVAVERAKRKFGVELLSGLPKIPYQETISVTTKTEYKHKKQSGGHGQYGHVLIELQPMPRGGGFEFGDRVVGGNVPKEYIPAVQKGVEKSLGEGSLAGYPIVDLKVVLYDGSSHPVDSSGMSFEIAGSFALKKGVIEGQPVLLEPVMHLVVTVPDTYTGEIIGDLNTKRAHILGMTPQGGVTVIEAEVPQVEIQKYATELRSLTQGRGKFTTEFSSQGEVPQHLAQRIIDDAKKEKATT